MGRLLCIIGNSEFMEKVKSSANVETPNQTKPKESRRIKAAYYNLKEAILTIVLP